MRADGGECLPFGIVDAHQEGRLIAELDDFAGVRLEVLNFAGRHFIDGNFSDLGWVEETSDGIENDAERGGDAASE